MRHAYIAYRFFLVMAGGIVLALTTSNPLYLVITVLGFVAMAVWVWRQGYIYEPRWEPLYQQGVGHGSKGEWSQALATFQTAMGKSRGASERRQASEQIGMFLLSNQRIGEAEPYLRQALNLTTYVIGPMAPRTFALRDKLSDLYIATGQPALAAQLQKLRWKAPPPGRPRTHWAQPKPRSSTRRRCSGREMQRAPPLKTRRR
jgi:hypothetical protein